MNAQKQKGQALNAASAQKAIDLLKVLLIFLVFAYFVCGCFLHNQGEKGRDSWIL